MQRLISSISRTLPINKVFLPGRALNIQRCSFPIYRRQNSIAPAGHLSLTAFALSNIPPSSLPVHEVTMSGQGLIEDDTMPLLDDPKGFGFIPSNPRDAKPRTRGVTEIRGPYYSVIGLRILRDALDLMSHHIDGFKFAGGSFALFPEARVKEITEECHLRGVYVSTGGWIEHILSRPGSADVGLSVSKYLKKCKELGMDVIEISRGFISLPDSDLANLIHTVQEHKLIPKPELGIQFGAGGDTPASLLTKQQSDPEKLVKLCKRFVNDLGVPRIMIESEGITENVPRDQWRTDVVYRLMNEVGLEHLMFEAADPQVFEWYVREFGIDVNLFVDHSQIVQLSALRSGIWGTNETFGRIVSFRPKEQKVRGLEYTKGE